MPHKATHLHSAALSGDTETIAALCAAGVDPNARNNDGFTPLHFAAELGHTEAIAALLKAGADPNAESDQGFTPLCTSPPRTATPRPSPPCSRPVAPSNTAAEDMQ